MKFVLITFLLSATAQQSLAQGPYPTHVKSAYHPGPAQHLVAPVVSAYAEGPMGLEQCPTGYDPITDAASCQAAATWAAASLTSLWNFPYDHQKSALVPIPGVVEVCSVCHGCPTPAVVFGSRRGAQSAYLCSLPTTTIPTTAPSTAPTTAPTTLEYLLGEILAENAAQAQMIAELARHSHELRESVAATDATEYSAQSLENVQMTDALTSICYLTEVADHTNGAATTSGCSIQLQNGFWELSSGENSVCRARCRTPADQLPAGLAGFGVWSDSHRAWIDPATNTPIGANTLANRLQG